MRQIRKKRKKGIQIVKDTNLLVSDLRNDETKDRISPRGGKSNKRQDREAAKRIRGAEYQP